VRTFKSAAVSTENPRWLIFPDNRELIVGSESVMSSAHRYGIEEACARLKARL
jgi:hypothetical protein